MKTKEELEAEAAAKVKAEAEKKAKEDADKKLASGDDDDGDPGDESKWDPKTKAYIEKLRKENPAVRTKALDLDTKVQGLNDKYSKVEKQIKKLVGVEEDKEVDADELQKRVGTLEEQLAKKELERVVDRAALKVGLTEEDTEFLQYQVEKHLGTLTDEEEMKEEELLAMAKKIKAKSVRAGNSSVDDKKAGGDKDPDSSDGPTLEAFVAMTITQKSLLYQKQPKVYESLIEQARLKRLI